MDAIVGFGARTAARVLRAIASIIDPPKEERLIETVITTRSHLGNVIPESVVAKQDIISIDNDTISVGSAVEVITLGTILEKCLSPCKRKNKGSPSSGPVARQNKKRITKNDDDQKTQLSDEYVVQLPFIFEGMDEVWMDVSVSRWSKLVDAGLFNKEQLRYCKTIHAVYQPMEEAQLTVDCNLLAVPHGQHIKGDSPLLVTDTKTKEHFPLFDGFPKTMDEFGFLETRLISDDTIPWLAVYEKVVLRKHKKGNKKTDQQENFVDVGFTSGHSTTQRSTLDMGVPKPSLLKGTSDEFMVDLFD